MKISLVAVACMLIATSPVTKGAPEVQIGISTALKLPALTPEELIRVPLTAAFEPGSSGAVIGYTIHNPFRDRVLTCMVLNIQDKKASPASAQSIDQFVTVDCAPLCNVSNQIRVFRQSGPESETRTVTLKEVHYYPLEEH